MGSPFVQEVHSQIDSAQKLEWTARNLARGLNFGKHNSQKIGVGMEFNQYRNYVQGDDIRLLDWKMYAKTQQYYIRQADIETNNSLHIAIDNSTSMDYSEGEMSKIELGKILTATLSYVIAQQSDQFGWSSGGKEFPKSQGLKNWRRSILTLDQLTTNMQSNKIDKATMVNRNSGVHVWVTDLYASQQDIEDYIATHNNPQVEMILFHLIGKEEEQLNFKSNTKFIDLETGTEMQVNAVKYAKEYKDALGQHVLNIKRHCQSKHVVYRKIYLQSDIRKELSSFLRGYNSLSQ